MHVSLRSNKGFSLVELMVVVAIIGILAAIAVPNFQRFAAKSKQSEAKSNLSALYSAERAFQSEWQIFRADFNLNGYSPTGHLRYTHGFAAESGTALPTNFAALTSVKGWVNTKTYCATTVAATANYCVEILTPVAPTLPATLINDTTFTAAAGGDLTGGVVAQDTWTIDQSKNLLNTVVGY